MNAILSHLELNVPSAIDPSPPQAPWYAGMEMRSSASLTSFGMPHEASLPSDSRSLSILAERDTSVDESLARHLFGLAGVDITWLEEAIPQFETAMRWPEA